MNNLSQLISVPIISAICYGIIEIYKIAANSNEKCLRFIPLIGAVLGLALGIVGFYCAPSSIPADNILSAIFVGLSSGLAATGAHQIFKQLNKGGGSEVDVSVNYVLTDELCHNDCENECDSCSEADSLNTQTKEN